MAYPSSLGFVGHFIQLVLDLSVQDTPPFSFPPYTTFEHNSLAVSGLLVADNSLLCVYVVETILAPSRWRLCQ
jgi:hypothetical protein